MNKLSNILLLLFSPLIFTACTKEKTTEQEFRGLFKNTEWTGEIKFNNDRGAEPFSIEFSDNGTFKWHELSGDYDGTYTINAAIREIKLLFTAGTGTVTATITQDNKFSNIISRCMQSCELNNSGTLNLDNTTWIGNGTSVSFKPYQIVEYYVYGTQGYTRTGTALRFIDSNFKFFSVIQPDNKTMRVFAAGLLYSEYHNYTLSKQ